MNPFERPEQWFPDSITDPDGHSLVLGLCVEARLGRRRVEGEIVGWRAPDRVRILTQTLHMHTVGLGEVFLRLDE